MDADWKAGIERRAALHGVLADPARLLQAVRDREARRQREKSRRKHGGYTPVEKDW